MLVALRMLIARSVSDLGKEFRSMISDASLEVTAVKYGNCGPDLLAQVDIA